MKFKISLFLTLLLFIFTALIFCKNINLSSTDQNNISYINSQNTYSISIFKDNVRTYYLVEEDDFLNIISSINNTFNLYTNEIYLLDEYILLNDNFAQTLSKNDPDNYFLQITLNNSIDIQLSNITFKAKNILIDINNMLVYYWNDAEDGAHELKCVNGTFDSIKQSFIS